MCVLRAVGQHPPTPRAPYPAAPLVTGHGLTAAMVQVRLLRRVAWQGALALCVQVYTRYTPKAWRVGRGAYAPRTSYATCPVAVAVVAATCPVAGCVAVPFGALAARGVHGALGAAIPAAAFCPIT